MTRAAISGSRKFTTITFVAPAPCAFEGCFYNRSKKCDVRQQSVMLTLFYNHWLVLASVAVGVLASYTALSLASRVAVTRGRFWSLLWLAGGAVSMGIGIWSMHFVGMLAANLSIPMIYDVEWTLLSLLIAVMSAGFILVFINQKEPGWGRLAWGGLLMGAGIVVMHYSGMAALRISPNIAYDPWLVALSVVIAVAASCLALWLALHLQAPGVSRSFGKRCLGGLVMGAAIAGMHYTGMAAANFAAGSICTVPVDNGNNEWLAATVITFTLAMLTLTLVISIFDSHLADRKARYAGRLMVVNQALKRESSALADANQRLQQEVQERIEARMVFEERILRLNGDLEDRVRARTAQLEALNQELEAFAYAVSHDLRAPLIAIDGFSQLLAKRVSGRLDEKGVHYLDRIHTAVQQMGELINGMLLLAKLSLEPLQMKTVDLTAMAEKLMREFRVLAPHRGAEISIERGVVVQGDPQLLHTLMQNLLGNAWKFTSKQTHVHISVSVQVVPGEDTVYVVRDNGVGFDMAYADKLFVTFQRLHEPGVFSGNGIGLALVHRIVNRHEGKIWALAAPGEGAEFRFTLGKASAALADPSTFSSVPVERISWHGSPGSATTAV